MRRLAAAEGPGAVERFQGDGREAAPPPPAGPGLYVHVPFCEKRCHYCAFNVYLLRDGGVDAYLSALEREMELYAPEVETPFATVFIGGGTPTALTAARLSRLLGGLRRRLPVAEGAEVTVEANPGTLVDGRLAALKEGGVNRLSIGVQSLNDDVLRALGRIHSARQARDCYERARKFGFDNVNLDLMFGLPGQDAADWRRTLREAAAWEPDHLSCYGLIIEEGTPFGRWHARGLLALPDEDAELEMYRFTREHLAARGFEHYEISNWARPGRQSAHNRTYWTNGQWLGLGPGAHSQWRGERFANADRPDEYGALAAAGRRPVAPGSRRIVPRREAMEDTLIFGLRLRKGVAASAFRAAFGVDPEEAYGDVIAPLVDGGLLRWDGEGDRRLRLTEAGLLVSNEVLRRFLR